MLKPQTGVNLTFLKWLETRQSDCRLDRSAIKQREGLMRTVDDLKALDNWQHLCLYFSLLWGVFCCGPTSSIVCHTNLQLLHYSALFFYEESAEVTAQSFSVWAFELSTPPRSKCNLAQCYSAKESHGEIDSGILKSQVWFHFVLTSAGALPTDARDERLINIYCDICWRGKCGNRKAEEKKVSAAPPPRPFVSDRTPLIFLLIL